MNTPNCRWDQNRMAVPPNNLSLHKCLLVILCALGPLFLAPKKQVAGLIEDEEGGGADIADGGLHHSKADVATVPAAVVVVPAVVKTITKGFEIRGEKE